MEILDNNESPKYMNEKDGEISNPEILSAGVSQVTTENIGKSALGAQKETGGYYIGTESDNSLGAIKLLNEYEDLIKSMLYKYSPNISYENMQDVLQEIRIRVWSAYDSFRGDSAVSTWLVTISRNTLYSFFKKEDKRGVKGGDVLFADNEEGIEDYQSASVESDEDQILEYMSVLDALSDVDEKYFKVLLLHALEFSTKEIADILDLNENTVKTHTKRGREKLKKLSLYNVNSNNID